VFATTDEDRLEPTLGSAIAAIAESREEPVLFLVAPAEADAYGSMDPGWSLFSGLPQAGPGGREGDNDGLQPPTPFEREQQADTPASWSRLRGPVVSLLLHLLPLLLLINWQWSPPAEVEPIPIQLVMEPPPPPAPAAKPAPQPQSKPTPPPPRGRLASEDLGEPEAKVVEKPKGDPPAADKSAKTETPPAETKPPEIPQQVAALVLPSTKPEAQNPFPNPRRSRRRWLIKCHGELKSRGIWRRTGRGSLDPRRRVTSTSPICIR
jgi:hypothetical protein